MTAIYLRSPFVARIGWNETVQQQVLLGLGLLAAMVSRIIQFLVGGFKHEFYFILSIIYGIILPID